MVRDAMGILDMSANSVPDITNTSKLILSWRLLKEAQTIKLIESVRVRLEESCESNQIAFLCDDEVYTIDMILHNRNGLNDLTRAYHKII